MMCRWGHANRMMKVMNLNTDRRTVLVGLGSGLSALMLPHRSLSPAATAGLGQRYATTRWW